MIVRSFVRSFVRLLVCVVGLRRRRRRRRRRRHGWLFGGALSDSALNRGDERTRSMRHETDVKPTPPGH